jgi:Fur family ferric uptake transcriptional regulator
MRDAQQELRSRGLRVTAPRLAVLQVLADMPHVSADTVANAVCEPTGTISTQGICNVVNALAGAGLVEPGWLLRDCQGPG